MHTKLKALLVICTVALGALLIGCAAQGNSANLVQQANRTYMSQVNETMVELDESLDSFVGAVSRGDVVTMRTQAANAFKVLDKLEGIKVPDELKEIGASYTDGAAKLREALDDYIELYSDLSSKDSDFDEAAYNERIAAIQSLYDEGVALLKAGDEAAAASQSSNSSASAGSAASASSESAAAAASGDAASSAATDASDASAASAGSAGSTADASSASPEAGSSDASADSSGSASAAA